MILQLLKCCLIMEPILNLKNSLIDPPFTTACEYATAAMGEFLVSRGPNVNPLDKHGIHPLRLACRNHFAGEAIIPILIRAGAKPDPIGEVLKGAFNNSGASNLSVDSSSFALQSTFLG